MSISTNLVSTNQNLLKGITDIKNVHHLVNDNLNQDQEVDIEDFFRKLQNEIKENYERLKKEIKEIDVSQIDVKRVVGSLLGATIGSALAYFTFNLALVPLSFLIQLLLTGGVAVGIPQQLLQLLQVIFSLGMVSTQYASTVAGAISGSKTTNQMLQQSEPTNIEKLKISFDKLKNSQNLLEYIRNGFNLGVQWAKETNEKTGSWGNIPLALAVGSVMMAPLALLVVTLSAGKIGLPAALGLGIFSSLPLGIKAFKTVKNFAKHVYGLIGGAIGGALGASIGVFSKMFSKLKGLSSKDENIKQEADEFKKNSPYKNQGIEEIMESTGKATESFIKGSSDVISFAALINNILKMQPDGLGLIASIIGGTIKSFEGASIMNNAGVDNKPEEFPIGLFRFLSGFSMFLSFLGSLFGPLGIIGFSLASLLFMGIEKIFAAKNKVIQNNSKENNENTLKNSYAIGTATGEFVDGLGSLGKFWMGWDTIFGGGYGGLTSIFGLVGATRDVLQGAKMMQMADERNNIGIGVTGLLNIIGGVSLAMAAIGLGRVFGVISLGTEIIKLVTQIYSLIKKDDQNNPELKPVTT